MQVFRSCQFSPKCPSFCEFFLSLNKGIACIHLSGITADRQFRTAAHRFTATAVTSMSGCYIFIVAPRTRPVIGPDLEPVSAVFATSFFAAAPRSPANLSQSAADLSKKLQSLLHKCHSYAVVFAVSVGEGGSGRRDRVGKGKGLGYLDIRLVQGLPSSR